MVPPPGIEPGSQPSEGRILSIEIQRDCLKRGKAHCSGFGLQLPKTAFYNLQVLFFSPPSRHEYFDRQPRAQPGLYAQTVFVAVYRHVYRADFCHHRFGVLRDQWR